MVWAFGSQHSAGEGAEYTRRRRPVRVVWTAEFPSVRDAYLLEKQIQGWSRAKREALIAGRLELLPGLARGHNLPSPPSRD